MAMNNTPELLDRASYDGLVDFFPLDVQKKIRATVEECEMLFTSDRHFDLVEKMNALAQDIKALEEELASASTSLESAGETPSSSTASPPMTAVTASPTNITTSLSAGLLSAFLTSTPMYETAMFKVNECQALSDDIHDHSTWTPTTSIDDKGYGTYYRAEVGKKAHSFKVIGEVHESVVYVASVIMELDLYTEWFPFCSAAQMQGEITRFHKSSRFVVQVPWPMSNREVFLVGYGVDDLQERKRVLITSRSIRDDEAVHPNIVRPPVGKGCSRISLEVGGFLIEALTARSCRVSFIMNVDPQIPHLPTWLVNWVSGKMIWVLLYEMDKAAKRAAKPKGKYSERRKNRPDIYVHFQHRAVEFYTRHFPGEPVPSLDHENE